MTFLHDQSAATPTSKTKNASMMQAYQNNGTWNIVFVIGENKEGKTEFMNAISAGTSGGQQHLFHGHQITTIKIGRKQLAVAGWPGFDGSEDSDLKIYSDIIRILCAQSFLGILLKGLIYVHDITKDDVSGTANKFVEVLRLLCGDDAMANIILLTTGWASLPNESIGCARERHLRKIFWRNMEGSAVRRFDGSRAMAEGLVCRLMRLDSITLPVQRSIVRERKLFSETLAGRLVMSRLRQRIQEDAMRIEELQYMLEIGPEHFSGISEVERQARLDERMSLLEKEAELTSRRECHISQLESLSNPVEIFLADLEKERERRLWSNPVDLYAAFLGLAITSSGNVVLPLEGILI